MAAKQCENQSLSHRELIEPCDNFWFQVVFACDAMQVEITALHSPKIGLNVQSRLSCFPKRLLFLISLVHRKKSQSPLKPF